MKCLTFLIFLVTCTISLKIAAYTQTILNTTPYDLQLVIVNRSCKPDMVSIGKFEEKTVNSMGCWVNYYYLYTGVDQSTLNTIIPKDSLQWCKKLTPIEGEVYRGPGPDAPGSYYIIIAYNPETPINQRSEKTLIISQYCSMSEWGKCLF